MASRAARRDARIAARHGGRDHAGERFHPADLVADRSQPLVEGHAAEPVETRLEARLPVLLPEEFGVGKPRPQHPLVAGKDDFIARRIGDPVADDDEARGQGAGGIACRQIFLMRPDRRLEHLVGKRHEPVLDGAEKRRRPFDKTADLVDEPLVRPQLRPGAGGQRGGGLDDGGAAAAGSTMT